MLTNQISAIINSNQWSKILSRTLNLNITHGLCKCSLLKVQHKNDILKRFIMSEESNKCDVVGTPSTSGSTSSDSTCDNSGNPNYANQSNVILNEVSNYSMVMGSPLIAVQGFTSHNYGVNCPANMQFLNDVFTHVSMNRRYYHMCQTQARNDPVRSRSVEKGKEKDKQLLSARVWENTNSNRKNSLKPGFIFTLMSYNVLAQDLLVQHPHLYQYHNQNCLQWRTRWNNLFKEIKRFNPDILCLQEVQESHIKDYFSLLETLGYKSVYKKRTGLRTEGCALYYKTDIVSLVEYTTVEYFQPNITILNRDNVGIVAKFSPKLHPTREFIVSTTHLLYNPKRQDVRLAQMQVLLTEIERISYKKKKKQTNGCYVPVIITGDLNSTPDTAVYEFVTKGKLNYEELSPKLLTKGTSVSTGKMLLPPELRITDNCQHADLIDKRLKDEKTSRMEELALIELTNSNKRIPKVMKEKESQPELFSTGTLSHNFVFKSVYGHGQPGNNEGTTFQNQWVTVDYIFYSAKKEEPDNEDKIKLLARYRLPTKNELNEVRIPNSTLGSDHLSLLAKFKLEY